MKFPEQRRPLFAACLTLVLASSSAGGADEAAPQPCSAAAQDGSKPATQATQRHNAALGARSNPADREDFEDAKRGLIARPDRPTITDAKGNVVWDLEAYAAFVAEDKPAPDTVNPSLWRNAQLELQHGLFEVVDGVYQVRGYDISNITFVRGSTGWIVGDPLGSVEQTQAAYELVGAHLGQKPVVAVVYSHAHVDHYAGVRALVSDADVQSGKVTIIAPDSFTEHGAGASALAGNAISRRVASRVGSLLPKSATGSVNGGLGQPPSPGAPSLLPNDSIERSGEARTIDGVEMVFQMTSGAEAPAEMNVFFPALRALWLAENTTHTQRDRLTPRGAEVRDGLSWARFLSDTIETYGPNIDTQFASHHWPLWGNARIVESLEKQRDLSQYIHDQSVRLLNQGHLGTEVAELLQLPPELDLPGSARDDDGGVEAMARAVYQRYLGERDPSPSALDPLPPAAAAQKYVEYMGGASAVLGRAHADFERGDYRWVVEALRHVVLATPGDLAAKGLLADAYEQLGYQSESASSRVEYLQAAHELRQGPVATPAPATPASRDRAMSLEQAFAAWGVRLDAQKAAGKRLSLVFAFSDLGQQWALRLQNSVLTASRRVPSSPDATVTLTRAALDAVSLGEATPDQSLASGQWAVTGRTEAVSELLAMLDTFSSGSDVVAP